MKVIGLCGGSGSGKGVVSSLFASLGIPAIDTDAVYRELTVRGSYLLNILSEAFGTDILNERGELDRKKLSALVFSDPAKHKLLNSITHSEILNEAERRIRKYESEGYPAVICDAPLLFESGFDKKCDIIIAVIAPLDVRIERLVGRDGISPEAARQRILSQLPDEYLEKHSDFVINNNGDLANVQAQIDSLVKIILK